MSGTASPLPEAPVRPVVVFSGGGTGGHLYPALAVADALRRRLPDVRVLFLGSQKALDRQIVEGSGWELVAQSVRPFRMSPWHWMGMLRGWRESVRDCRSVLRELRPAAVVGSGGYASVPALWVARELGLRTAILNPDALPGRATRLVNRKVDRIFVQWDSARRYFGPRRDVRVTGCPIRADFLKSATRQRGIELFVLDPAKKTLLITGASQGARSVNDVILAGLDRLVKERDWQLLHLTGEKDYNRVLEAYNTNGVTGRVLAFTDRMAEAMACADLVVSRAGASTLAELTAMGKASILMPYPYHRDQHQMANARVLAEEKAACIVEDRVEATANLPRFLDALLPLLSDDKLRGDMSAAAKRLGRPDAAERVAEAVIELGGHSLGNKAGMNKAKSSV